MEEDVRGLCDTSMLDSCLSCERMSSLMAAGFLAISMACLISSGLCNR